MTDPQRPNKSYVENVVLDESVAALDGLKDTLHSFIESLGEGRIERQFIMRSPISKAIIGKQPRGIYFDLWSQRSNPKAWMQIAAANLRREIGHTRKASSILPTVNSPVPKILFLGNKVAIIVTTMLFRQEASVTDDGSGANRL